MLVHLLFIKLLVHKVQQMTAYSYCSVPCFGHYDSCLVLESAVSDDLHSQTVNNLHYSYAFRQLSLSDTTFQCTQHGTVS